MTSPRPAMRSYSLGAYTLDLERGALMRAGADVALRPKSYAVLCYLVEHHGRLVTKQELLDAVWGHTAVTEGALTQSLIDIRRALGDESQRMLRTVRGRGYRFDVPSEGPGGQDDAAISREPRPSVKSSRPARLILVLGAIFAAAVLWWTLADRVTDESPAPEPPQRATLPRSVAVLPFADLSTEGDQEYFSHGISEEILDQLSSVRELHVIARTSSFAFADSGYDVPRLTGILGVQYLLQGSVRKDGRALRISAQLVDASGRQVWSDAFDRELADVFAIQMEIADAVATSIAPQISPPTGNERLPDVEAYEHYLAAREIVHQRNYWQFARALELLDRTVAIDPGFAEAYAERAVVLSLLPDWPEDRAGADEQAARDLDRALSLKPDLARAQAARWLLLDAEEGEGVLTRALALDPNMVDARVWLANALSRQGRLTEAEAELELAARLDPLSPRVNVNLAMEEAERGDFASAEPRLTRLLELPEPSTVIYEQLWTLYVTTGRLVEAAEVARQVPRDADAGGDPSGEMLRMRMHAYLGLWQEAEAWQTQAERLAPDILRIGLNRAWLLGLQERHEEALRHFREKLDSHGGPGTVPPAYGLYYGMFLALNGAYDDAIIVLEPVALTVESRAGIRYAASEALQWLAWLHQQTGAPKRAAELLEAVEQGFLLRQVEGRLRSSQMLYQFAVNALLSDDSDAAIDRLRDTVDAGWRGYYAGTAFYGVRMDPRWRPLRDDRRFLALMAAVKADVDAQRAEVERRLGNGPSEELEVDSLSR